jgi:hypothetical protein
MAKPDKRQPTEKLTPKQAAKLKTARQINRQQGQLDAEQGRDTRMSRDGGTGRRTRW